jgi:FG-GAP-like repeat
MHSLVVADFNNDGHPDLAVATAAGGIEIFLGLGDGSFEPASIPFVQSVPPPNSGPAPQLVLFVADFNGDGNQDLVVRDITGPVLVYFGDGQGGFSAPVSSPFGGSIVAVDDFNGDGRPDLVVESSDGISLLLGKGDGTFSTTPPVFSLGMQAPGRPPPCCISGVVADDFNGDGNLDLALALSSSIVVLSGRGDGSFDSPIVIPEGPFFFAGQLFVADVNGDSIPDLIALGGERFAYFLGDGTGSFQPKVPITGSFGTPLVLADFNGDGKIDIVFGGGGGGQAGVTTSLNNSPQPPRVK